MTSPDGITWTVRSALGDDDEWQGVACSNGLLWRCSRRRRVMSSLDGITWIEEIAVGNDDAWVGVAYGEDRFVALGNYYLGNEVMYSDVSVVSQTPLVPLLAVREITASPLKDFLDHNAH